MTKSGPDRDAVLVPTGYDPASYPSVRSLGGRGIHTIVASQFDDVPAAASRYCDETAVLPAPDDDLIAYRDALLGLAARPDVQTIVPIRPEDTYVLSKYEETFEQYVSLVTPPMDVLRRAHDRILLAEAAENAGVPIPETRLMEDAETGEYKITEINPRMWQSLPATVRMGADFPWWYWLQATGRADEIEPGYDLDVGSHLLYGELGYFLSILTHDSPLVERPKLRHAAWEILSSCYDQPNFDYLRLDDPGPFVQGVLHMLKS